MKLIAEIGSNHNQNWNRCAELIMHAKKCGFSGVKFQLFDPERLYAENCITEKEIENLKKRVLPIGFIPRIKDLCIQEKLEFGMSVFYNEAVEECKPYVDYLKISSFDVNRFELIRNAVDTKLPVHLSCGLSTLVEIARLKRLFKIKLFYHCVSEYPCPIDRADLKRISFLKESLGLKEIGYSDHTVREMAIVIAYAAGVSVCEMHFDLTDRLGYENIGHCWDDDKMFYLNRALEEASELMSSNYDFDGTQKADRDDGLRPEKIARRKSE